MCYLLDLVVGAGTGQPVNGAIPSLPASPTMPNFNMAAQTPNGHQPTGADPGVYTNGLGQAYQPREYRLWRIAPPLRVDRPIHVTLLLRCNIMVYL